jgi:hypothetical protein
MCGFDKKNGSLSCFGFIEISFLTVSLLYYGFFPFLFECYKSRVSVV